MNRAQKAVQQAQLNDEKHIIKLLERVYDQARNDCERKIRELSSRTDLENLQSIIYQKQYQEALKKQLDGILDNLQSEEFTSIADYLQKSYHNGYVGVMYDLHNQGIPIISPINQEQVVKALQTDSKLSKGLYARLGEDVSYLKRSIRAELSRGVANGSTWNEIAGKIAKGMNSPYNKAINNAIRIARTEGHRVQQKATLESMIDAKKKGADIVKQWDSTLDRKTRLYHRILDGQIKEVEEDFEVDGLKTLAPGHFGKPSEDCNCRCCLLQRARWALDEEELDELKERASYFGLDKTDDFEDFKKKYLAATQSPNSAIISVSSIGTGERKLIKKAKNPVQMNINGIDCEASYTQFVFSDGTANSQRTAEGAFVFKAKDGVEFIFREKMNRKYQTMTPEKAMELWQRVPLEVRGKAQRKIQFVDYYNPQDSYWRKVYKNFPHSYATGGTDITFYRYEYAHDEDYVVKTYCHEAGHFIDMSLGTSKNPRFCEGADWTNAMKNDIVISGKKSPTTYGENSNSEDFAESIAEYVTDTKGFEMQFPNRAKLLKSILKI